MFKTLHFKSLFLLLCLIIGGSSSAWGEEVTYKLTIDNSSFNTTSYTANNNEKTSQAICTTDNTKTYEVKWTTNQIMKGTGGNAGYMQWQKNAGYLYNSTNLGTITNVTITKTSGTFTTYYGTSAQPSSNTTVGEGFFQIKVGNATGYTTRIEVTFKIDEAPAATLTGISVKTPPTKTAYKVGEALDLSGLELLATYDNNETTGVTTGYTTSPTNGANLSAENTKVTITYKEKTTVQAITVGTLSSISSNADFAYTTYTEKEYFNPEGLVITAHYSNGIEEVVNDYTLNPSATTALETTNDKVTVSYTWANETKTVEIPITVNAGTKYTVTFDAQTGTCGTASLTEEVYQGGVTLPSATCSMAGWVFAGWAEAAVKNTTTKPILYAAGETYYPTEAKTLYAVYTLEETINKFVQATSNNDIYDGANVVISSLGNNKYTLANDNETLTGISNFTPDNFNIITCTDSRAIWTLNTNSTSYTINNNGKSIKRSAATLTLDNTGTNWSITKATTAGVTGDKFLIKDASYNYYIEHNGTNWIAHYTTSTSANSINGYLGMTIYVASPTAYNSNPAGAIVDPDVTFEKGGTTLYLDGTTTYKNAATVTGVNKTATYTSSDESVATVASDGTVTAVGIGTATITASVAQELGVNNAASATYEIVVKSTTTIAGIKNITDASYAVNFAADLTDAVVTYVNGDYAYIQDATAAIMVKCSNHGLIAGNTITSIEGIVKAPNQIDQISAITEKTMGETGAIPTAEEKTLAEIITAGTEYDGKLVKVNAATVSSSMNNEAASGASISDDNGTTSFNLYAPNTGITVNASEIGNFTGFVSIYNGTNYRLNLYDQSQIVLTQNAAREQELSFDEDAIVLDEETTEFDNFIGQAVNGAQGTVTYTISGDAIGTVDNDGIVELYGTCGTATVTATAAAINKEVEGIPTPYKTATKSYTITVRPRYTVTFVINGIETEVREASFGAGVTAPTPAQIGEYSFVGWSTTEVEATDEEPTMVTVANPSSNSEKYYAVFAKERAGGEEDVTSTLNIAQNEPTTPYINNGVTWSWNNVTFGNSGSGMKASQNASVTFTLPESSIKAKSITLSCPNSAWGSGATVVLKEGNTNLASLSKDGSYTFTNDNNSARTYTLTQSTAKNAWINAFVLTYSVLGTESYGYTTNPTQIAFGGSPESNYTFATFSSEQAVVFTGDVEVFAVTVDDANNLVKSELTQDDYLVENEGIVENGYYVPANTGVMLRGTANSYNYHIAATTEDVTIPTNMLIAGTNAVPAETDYKYYKLTYEDASHQHIGFYWGAAEGAPFMTKKGKAYLRLPKTVNARGFSLFDDDDTTTGIEKISSVMNDGEVYNLNGLRVDNLKKGGLYIVNGKKVVIK